MILEMYFFWWLIAWENTTKNNEQGPQEEAGLVLGRISPIPSMGRLYMYLHEWLFYVVFNGKKMVFM